jgi:protease-4
MRFAHITNAVYRQPWNITPGGWLSVHELLQSRLAVDAENLDLSAFVNPRPDLEVDSNGIAHIHVTGVLGKNLSQIERSCGNTGYEQLEAEVADAVKANAQGILLHVNSPGGAATGNVETSRMVAGSGLPTVAWVDELAASAAYAIASGATLIVASPSAQVGSIGTIPPSGGYFRAMGTAWTEARLHHPHRRRLKGRHMATEFFRGSPRTPSGNGR